MSSNLIVLIYFLSFTKIDSCRNCLRITHMYNEAKVNTVIIFARKNGAAVHENAQADNLSCSISTPAMDHKKALMRTTASAEQARKAKTTLFSVSLVIVTMVFHEA
jgi:hypothetical protein